MIFLKLAFVVYILTGCLKDNVLPQVHQFEVHTVAKEVKIPKIIMMNLEDELTKESKTIAPMYLFMPIQVQFNELTSGVLKNQNMKLNLNRHK